MIVVDTNVIASLHLPGPRASAAEALLRLDPEWAAPLLWRSEFRNVLAGYIRAGKLLEAEAERVMRQAGSGLIGREHAVSDHAVLELIGQSKCTAYDCEFVALALALDTLLITDDRAVLQAFPRKCRSLDEAIGRGVNR